MLDLLDWIVSPLFDFFRGLYHAIGDRRPEDSRLAAFPFARRLLW